MQARHASPPSSPPSAARHGDPASPSEARVEPSPVWTAPDHPSPSATLANSSPELPPLPTYSLLGSFPRSPSAVSTVARHEPTDSSYYTASWGSPYRNPPQPPAFNLGAAASTHFGSDDFEEESSGLQFDLEHLLPPRLTEVEENRFSLEHLIPSRIPPPIPVETPTRASLTSEATPRSVAFNFAANSSVEPTNPSEAWLRQLLDGNLSDASTDTEDRQTATSHQKSPVERKKGHRSRKNNLTLKQQDFWSHFSQGQKEELGKMMASRYADPPPHKREGSGASIKSALGRSTHADRPPLPPRTSPNPQEEAPRQPQAAAEAPLPPRQRKKIIVKGKACWINIARDIPRGTPGFPPKPMSAADLDAKMQRLEQQGYDTRGFSQRRNLSANDQYTTQNRDIWPSESFIREERASAGRPRVRVPNKADWDAYENHLMEAKLAALGVSLGGDEEESAPPSRVPSSGHPGLPFSPPLPSGSAGSHRIRQGSIVSGSFPLGPSPGHASRQSIASPMSAFGVSRAPSMHMHRHSTFASPASFIQQSTSPAGGAWSPGGYFGSQGARGGSPALPLSRPDLNDIVSPHSPFGIRPNQQFPLTPKDDLLAQMQQQQQQLQNQLLQQQQQQQQQFLGLRPSSTLAEVPEDEGEEEEIAPIRHAAKSRPEIAVPTPRGHRHNISANLEREARDAEYHLEEAIDKQFEDGGDFSTEPEVNQQLKPSNPITDSNWEGPRPILHQPQPHNRAHSIAKSQQPFSFGYGSQQNDLQREDLSDGARTNVSEATNPSLEEGEIPESSNGSAQHSKSASQVNGGWGDSRFAFPKSESAMHSKHTSKSSISKLNVDAKEFKFNPSASFSPSAGSFSSSFSFAPAAPKPSGQDATPRSNKPSIDGLAGFNAAAPAFKPDAPAFKPVAEAPVFKPAVEAPVFKPAVDAPVFKPAGLNGSTAFSSSFNFGGQGQATSFKPDAPAFNPSVSAFNPGKPATAPTNFSSKIFGDVNISASDMVKPAKRSKAIPIVPPSAARQKTPEKISEPEDQEDESGRIMQAEGREKRARHVREDGDDVPQFAPAPTLASQPLAEAQQPQAAKAVAEPDRKAAPEDKENLAPNVERGTTEANTPKPLAAAALRHEGPSLEPSIPTPNTDIEIGSRSDSKTPIDDRTPHESDAVTPTVEEAPKPVAKKLGHKSSLSATAKPFEFRAPFGSSGFDFGIHVTKPSVANSEDVEDHHMSPPRNASRSPATTFRPSDDGSFKTALDRHAPRSHYAESESVDFENYGQPSFNEIDAVMKHMNEEGSDFGVERDEPSWEQSSPRRAAHNFDRNDLPPNTNLRSDAPSPSPRRLYAPKNLNASSTSITHDPFSDERAGLAYESPVHRLNNADEVPMSDWDEGITSEGEDKIQTRSRFFDSHVDDLISRLLQSRLGPLEKNLQGIQDALAVMGSRPGRGRRSMSTNDRLDSDADDEDDEIGTDSHYRNRSPRKDRRLEKIRAIVKEALETHQPAVTSLPVPVPESSLPEKIRTIVIEAVASQQAQIAPAQPALEPENVRDMIMEALAHHQPQWTPPKTEHVPAEEIRSIVKEAIASRDPAATEATATEAVKPDDIRSIVMEAFATHAPPPVPAPAPEQIWPDDIRAVVAEALVAHQAQIPSPPHVESIQPDTIRSIVAELLESHKPEPSVTPAEPINSDAIRSIVAEALESHKPAALAPALAPAVDIPQPQLDLSEIYQVIGSLKASIAHAASGHIQADDIKAVVEEALNKQSMQVAEKEEAQTLIEKTQTIEDLEQKLAEARLIANEASEARRVLEARAVDDVRLLKVTEEELALLKEASKSDEINIRTLQVEKEEALDKLAAFHTGDDDLRTKLAALQAENDELRFQATSFKASEDASKRKLDAVAAENEALNFTLEQHRLSADKFRTDIQVAHEENEKMRKAIEASCVQTEEAARLRETMRAKFDKLQQDMVIAAGQASAERAQWQKSDEEHMKKYEVLSARIEAEGRTRERLERELERLEHQEREGMRLKIALEQTQKGNVRLEEVIDQLKEEVTEHKKTAERYEREFREAREAGRVEVRRTRVLMEADIDAANNQVNIVRADLESEIARVRTELDNVRMDADTVKAKHELDLEAASDEKKQALEQAMQSRNAALQEQQQTFERRLQQLSHEHSRALTIAQEDQERADAFHNDRLALAESKHEHLHDKIRLLEERLNVTKEAASAAAQAAQNVKLPAHSSSLNIGEKISPQALRESIAVLQEQLQERESRIESLEQKLAEVDTDAPNKLKERDTEINWLRELLGVRVDDLNDLINSLAQPTFDRETVRDAAIRIRTNLQMEQQEKERLISGGQNFSTLASLSNFASPKAVQLAAAFGNWRKGRESASSALAGNSASNSRNQTPSRHTPASAQSFLSGLMTPPTSNLRRTPDLPSSGARPRNLRSAGSNSSLRSSNAGFPGLGTGKQPVVPSTPPLLRKASYDLDAEDGHFSESGFYDDDRSQDGDVTPIGLNFGQELGDR